MNKNYVLFIVLAWAVFSTPGTEWLAQESEPLTYVIAVDMVQLNVAVTDSKGNYVTGCVTFRLRDCRRQHSAKAFCHFWRRQRTRLQSSGINDDAGWESHRLRLVGQVHQTQTSSIEDGSQSLGSMVAGANVFLLFDTSNYMYRGFVFAQDAIADFVRSLETADKVAFYSYSRDLSRPAL